MSRPDARRPAPTSGPADPPAPPGPDVGDALSWWLEPPDDTADLDRFRIFLDPLPVPFVLGGARGEILRANRAFCALVGRDEAELQRGGLALVTHPEDAAREMALFDEAIRAGRSTVELRKRYLLPDGTVVPVLLRSILSRDGGGRVTGGLNHVTDLTEHERESARRERAQEQRFRLAFENAPIGMSMLDLDGRFLRANPRMLEITGYSEEELRGRTFLDITHPDDVARDRESMERLRAGAIDRHETEKRYLRRDGRVIWAMLSVSVLRDAEGRPECFLVQWQDVTARRDAEERARHAYLRLTRIADTLPILVYVLDVVERRCVYANAAIEDVGGYTLNEFLSLSGDGLLQLFHPDDLPSVLAAWERIQRSPDETVIEMDFRARHKDGTWRWVRCRQAAFERDPDGLVRTHVGGLEDVTEQRSLEDQLRQSQKMEAIGRLAGGVAHDFNNLLTAILGYTDMARQKVPAANPAVADLEQAVLAAQRAATLTRQLLAFGRPQVLDLRLLDLNVLIRESLGLVRRMIGEDIVFDLRLATEPCGVRADPSQVTQALFNMAINARDAMPRGGTLTIVTEVGVTRPPGATAEPAAWIRLAVTDTGAGMDEATRSRAFEPFFTTKAPGKGSGLGLAMVYGFVQSLGGTALAHSTPGRGTTIELFLPCAGPAADPGPVAVARPAYPEGTRERLLVVEDEPAVRELMCGVLERAGFRVRAAGNGAEALAILTGPEGDVDLVVSDVVMPGLGGPEMVERARKIRGDLRALFVTGYADDSGGDMPPGTRCLRKPFSPDALVGCVRDMLGPARS